MPSRNILKQYVPEGIYHVYNRGVEKRIIFMDERDYKTFLYFLKQYLLSPDNPKRNTTNYKGRTFVRRSFYGRIELLAYCLMDNHFHIILKQEGEGDMSEFMKCLATSYSIYFNGRHRRVGGLFQGRYKAILVNDDNYLLHLSRYLHLNPLEGRDYKGPSFARLIYYDFSSYQEYLGLRNSDWVKKDLILNIFYGTGVDTKNKYRDFVEGQQDSALESTRVVIGDLALE